MSRYLPPRRVRERSTTSTAGIVKPTLAPQTTVESEASVPADVPSSPVHPRDFGVLSWHERRTGRPHPSEFTHGSPISPAVVNIQRDADGMRHVDIYLEDGTVRAQTWRHYTRLCHVELTLRPKVIHTRQTWPGDT